MRVTVEHLRGIEWGRAYSWDLMIEGAPSPFDSWTPVFDVQETLYDINDREFEVGNIKFAVPESLNIKTLNITFYDDDRTTMYQFMEKWANSMFPDQKYVLPLKDCLKTITVRRFDSTGLLTRRKAVYRVFPRGQFIFNGKSESEPLAGTVDFVVVGEDIENQESTGLRIPILGEVSSITRIGEAL